MTFQTVHAESVVGTLTHFDRLIFKGHLSGFFPDGAFQRFLSRQGVVLKDFGRFVDHATEEVKRYQLHLAKERRVAWGNVQPAGLRDSVLLPQRARRAVGGRADPVSEDGASAAGRAQRRRGPRAAQRDGEPQAPRGPHDALRGGFARERGDPPARRGRPRHGHAATAHEDVRQRGTRVHVGPRRAPRALRRLGAHARTVGW